MLQHFVEYVLENAIFKWRIWLPWMMDKDCMPPENNHLACVFFTAGLLHSRAIPIIAQRFK